MNQSTYTIQQNNTNTKINSRPQEYAYLKQIFNQYVKGCNFQLVQRMFKTLHSDWLNLTLSPSINIHSPTQHHLQSQSAKIHSNQNNISRMQILRSQSHYSKGDIIMEIRGSIINKNKLELLLQQNSSITSFLSKTNCLLWGETNRIQVLVPKGISAHLLKKDSNYMQYLQRHQNKSNCTLQFQPGPKYLVEAETEINAGDALILNLKSLEKHIYHQSQSVFQKQQQ